MTDVFVQALKAGKVVKFRPKGNSMTPKIKSGEEVTVSPEISGLSVGDIVFCRVKSSYYVHLIKAIEFVEKERFQIGNNHGRINGWIGRQMIFGKVIEIAP